ncbi:LysR family transcriptional regulator [Paenibacillus aceris]|uniref:DNA-binding transcriptional LysR family regulator n=1 Tax=Paenibacillus aceris TaxID=869555 RepID=A0ABS4HSK3_9BACL|nr:LysR family transcriptional regulator [Paenibacillus aceris]MBP1961594.1 DNA-binding transcriptional LysR family regulator [Paenibacillus aceris]NHW37633.1 LysR family transcriptional regulator [Paenibacillus aceris]
MRIEQLLYLIEINQTGSISLAAEKLHVSQPNISQAIVSLEEELGVKLFNRSRFGAVPTDDGKLIISKAEEIISKVEELRESVGHHAKELTGLLSIASVPSLCLSVLPPALAIFKEKHPGLELEMLELDYQQIKQEVLSGNVDMGLIAVSRQYEETNKQLTVEKLMDNRVMACVGKNSPFSERTSISIEELAKQPILLNSDYLIEKLKKHGEPNILFKLGNSEAAKRVIAEGIAIGFYTELGLKYDPYILTGSIVALEITGEDMDVSFCSIRLKNRHQSIACREFTKELKSIIATNESRIYLPQHACHS